MASRSMAENSRKASAVTAASSASRSAKCRYGAGCETPSSFASALMLIASGPPCSASRKGGLDQGAAEIAMVVGVLWFSGKL